MYADKPLRQQQPSESGHSPNEELASPLINVTSNLRELCRGDSARRQACPASAMGYCVRVLFLHMPFSLMRRSCSGQEEYEVRVVAVRAVHHTILTQPCRPLSTSPPLARAHLIASSTRPTSHCAHLDSTQLLHLTPYCVIVLRISNNRIWAPLCSMVCATTD